MVVEKINYSEFNKSLKQTICRAGLRIMEIYVQDFDVDYKDDNSPVTKADQIAEEIIIADLKDLAPHIPIIAEESCAAGIIPDTENIFWLVDPLDGTKSFIAKNDEFTVNIALIENGVPTLGLIYAPALNLLYTAVPFSHAVRQKVTDHIELGAEEIIRVKKSDTQNLTALASKSHRDDETNNFLHKHNIKTTKSIGSSLKLCLLAEGSADIYPRFGPTMEWDIAAGHAILNAAGGIITHPSGEDFKYGKKAYLNGAFIARPKNLEI